MHVSRFLFVVVAMTLVFVPNAFAAKVTYADNVAQIFYKNCAECHRPNSVAPMSLLTYKEARPWAKSIRKAVANREMPPWDADPNVGHFSNDISLSQEDIDTILAWVDQGTPSGDLERAPEPPTFSDGWKLGEPDYILEMPEYQVAADGKDGFPNIYLNIDTTEEKYLRAVELQAGDSRVLHHIVLFEGLIALSPDIIDARTKKKAQGMRPTGANTLYVWAAGSPPSVFPEGYGHTLKPGQEVSINAHYHPFGEATTDRSKIGLYFADKPVTKEITTAVALNSSLRIPPGAKGYSQNAYYTFHQDSKIISFLPHMHTRGESMLYKLHYPDGKTKDILNVPDYDYNWQWIYYPEDPITVPAGTSMEVIASYDNSGDNELNPDPESWVQFGEGTNDEMLVGFADFIVDDGIAPVFGDLKTRMSEAMHLRPKEDCYFVDAGMFKAGLYLPKEGEGMLYLMEGDFMITSSLLDLQWSENQGVANARMLIGAADTIPFGLGFTLDGEKLTGKVYPNMSLTESHLDSPPPTGLPLKGVRLASADELGDSKSKDDPGVFSLHHNLTNND